MWNVVHRMAPRTLLRKLQSTWRDHLEERRLLAVMRAERDEFLAADGGRFEPGADWPCLRDRRASIPFDRHYFYHPAWACRVLRSIDPAHHVDISSIFSFAGCVSAFWPTTYYEYQPPVGSVGTHIQSLPRSQQSRQSRIVRGSPLNPLSHDCLARCVE